MGSFRLDREVNMTRLLSTILVLLLAAAVAAGQEPPGPRGQGTPVPKERDRLKMDNPPGEAPKEGGAKEEGGKETPAEAPPVDPFAAALAGLSRWPAPESREAAAALSLLGPEVEERLVAALTTADPAQASGICFVLGEIGGDRSIRALQTIAGRPSMVDRLDVVFEAIGKLEGLNAVQRILPFLRHPKRPARTAAENWLMEHVDASHIERLEALVKDPFRGARLSALRLLGRVDPPRAVARAFDLLGDESPEVARSAADLLSSTGGPEIAAELNRIATGPDERRVGYAAIALALLGDRSGSPAFTPETVQAMLGRRGLRASDKLNRGAAAILLSDVGYTAGNEEVDAIFDRDVVDVLLDTFGGQTFFLDYSSIAELARDRFGKVTGIIERRPVPDLWDWWRRSRETFVARRALRSLDPDAPGEFRIRVRSLAEPALSTTLYSNVAADAGLPEMLNVDFVFLLPAAVRDLAGFAASELLPLPDEGALDPFRAAPDRDQAAIGPDVVITLSSGRRSRTITARRGSVPAAVQAAILRLLAVKSENSWQRFWDRATWPRIEDFIADESTWYGAEHPPEAVSAHTKELILKSLDDIVTPEGRAAALDALDRTGATLTDSDAYALALLLEQEAGLTPYSERLVRLMAKAGRPLVLPILSDWLEQNPGPRSLDLFAEALSRMGGKQVLTAAASDRIYLVRAAMRAAPDALEGDELLRVLAGGLAGGADPVRREALLALGRSGRPEALDLIRGALADPEIGVRNAAVEALGALRRPEVVPVLTKELASEDFGRRVAAVTALAATGLDEAISPVLACLSHDASPAVRAVAGREIAGFGARAMPGLTALVTNTGQAPEIRAGAIEALVRVGGDGIAAVLTALLSDPAPEVADAAAFALARRQSKEAVPPLLVALDAGRDPIRTLAALEQVSCLSFPAAKAQELPAIYRGWWSDHREEAPVEWFLEALRSKGYDVTELATLGEPSPAPETVPVLIRILLDGSWYLRANANLWLSRVAAENFGEVTRFTSPEDVRAVHARWLGWWEGKQ